MGLLKDSIAKVGISVDIEKLKAEKRLTACKCKIDGCDNVGQWQNKDFYLLKGMCQMHYQKDKKYGDPLAGRFANDFIDGRTTHPLYGIWYKLRDRITNKKCKVYPRYGGRGLEMESSWIPDVTGFWQFVSDIAILGERPNGYTLDRKDNEIGYLIGNLRWANDHRQGANKRNNNNNVGVNWHKAAKKWRANLMVNKTMVLISFFDTEAEAIKARKDAEKLHGISYD